MAEICCGVVNESKGSTSCVPSSRAARRRRMEIRRFKFVTGVAPPETDEDHGQKKRQKLDLICPATSFPRDCDNATEKCNLGDDDENGDDENGGRSGKMLSPLSLSLHTQSCPKFGVASVCGRRRDMEDAVAIHPWFCRRDDETETVSESHYFGVYDGHGCSHVATRCRDRLHDLVKEELESTREWKSAMERSFTRMDKEVIGKNESVVGANCRCELQTPECDAVGSTAVVAIVTPHKIIVANCGDSRAVLCRNGKPIPLSVDHKPDLPDELNRIQEAGGRVIYWDVPRVLGVLAMSRAIGDNYLKPYVTCEPEVTITDRTAEDDCLILASDGLWDVVSNDMACGVARMCLRGKSHAPPESATAMTSGGGGGGGETTDKACSDASMLLTKLALAKRSTDNVSVVVVDLRRDT